MSVRPPQRIMVGMILLVVTSSAVAVAQDAKALDANEGKVTDPAPLIPRGEQLLGELNCTACHEASGVAAEHLRPKSAPRLEDVGNRLRIADITEFITNPAKVKPGTTMPHLFPTDEATKKAIVIAHYLASLRVKAKPAAAPLTPSVERGRLAYHSVGCIACHAPQPAYRPTHLDESIELTAPVNPSTPIALASRYSHASLASYLLDPLSVRSSGRMPNMKLKPQEAADIAAYLQRDTKPADAPESPDAALVPIGRAAFSAIGCANCHDTGERHSTTKSVALLKVNVDAQAGCLSDHPGATAADFRLSTEDRKAIKTAIAGLAKAAPLTAAERVDRTMAALNCLACHDRDGRGGPELARALFFHSTTDALGDEGRIPPPLTGIGSKLTEQWLARILTAEGGSGEMRPHLLARMPLFGKENVGHLIKDFAAADPVDAKVTIDVSGGLSHHRGFIGRTLMGSTGLNCITCHGLKDQKALGPPAMNLSHTAQRLRPQWFKQMMLNPQVMRSRTIMPAFFADGKSPVTGMMSGRDAGKQIEQIWIYLKELDQSPLPEGMAAQSFVLKPDSRPIVFRTFMEGAGMQAIAVGFPQHIHAAFDAHEVRWALAWRGDFLDAEATWIDRFSPLTKPLSADIHKLPAHAPLAMLASASAPWPKSTGKEAGYTFGGYRLDKARVPTFLYSLSKMEITDRLEPSKDGKTLHRTLTVSNAPDDLYFRGFTGKPQRVQLRNGAAVIEEVIQW